MKVSVTFDVGDEARIGIALRGTGELRPATRLECADWLLVEGDLLLAEQARRVNVVKAQLLDVDLQPVPAADLTG